MRIAVRVFAIAGIGLIMIACGRDASVHTVPSVPEPAKVSADIQVDDAAIPAVYSAPLPTTSAGLAAWPGDVRSVPMWHAVDHIVAGTPAWLERFKQSASAVAPVEAAIWAREWTKILEYQDPSPAFCREARSLMAAPASTARTAISTLFSSACARSDDRALVLRADTANEAVLAFFEPFRDDGTVRHEKFDARLGQAAHEAIVNGDLGDARRAAFLLAEQRDGAGVEALLRLHAQIEDKERADTVALAFKRTNNADGLRRADEACARLTRDPMCTSEQHPIVGEDDEDPPTPIDAIKARVEQLQALGFTRVGSLDVTTLDSDVTEDLLMRAGYAHWFDVETGMFPNMHDSLLRQLARLVSPSLDEAVFAERAPDADSETDPYELTVYAAGKRYRTAAMNLGDWYDLAAVTRLLDRLCADLKLSERYHVLETGDQTAILLAAAPEIVNKAVAAGVITLSDPGDAERVGKEFEEAVIEKLNEEGR